MAEKTIKPPAIKQQKIKEYNNTRRTDFLWNRHKDNTGTQNVWGGGGGGAVGAV